MESQQGRYKGVRKDSGMILKGTLTEAPLKVKASSIPSKNENIVYSNHHQSAFGNSQERFYVPTHQKESSTPGPGNYNPLALSNKVQSKRGSGNFASITKLQRFNDKRNWNPGPGRYEYSLQKDKKSKSTYQFINKSQARDIFEHEIKVAGSVPGPGDYDHRLRRSVSTHCSVFKSNINRFRMNNIDAPPIGYYKWQEQKKKILSYKFSSPQNNKNEKSLTLQYQNLDNLIGKKLDSNQEVGPGKYTPQLLEANKGFTIRDGKLDRFGGKKDSVPTIEPKTQITPPSVPTTIQTQRNTLPSSVFKSKSKRYEFGQREKEQIGDPGIYSPTKNPRQSHIINFAQKWI